MPRRKGTKNLVMPGAEFQECPELAAAGGVAQLAQCFRFDLADALAGYREALADLFERALAAVFQAKAHLDDLLFARRQRLQHPRRLLLQVDVSTCLTLLDPPL